MDIVGGNELTRGKSVLVVRSGYAEREEAIRRLSERFFGQVLLDPSRLMPSAGPRRVYACGDLNGFDAPEGELVHVIEDLSRGHQALGERARVLRLGQVPKSVHGLGVLFEELFVPDDLFGKIRTEHAFQALTESTKPSQALRSGIYLSEVTREADALRFHLLRCSSNLSGPTDNFRATDRRIIGELNELARCLFEREVQLNHVLAQIYANRRAEDTNKQRKARIGAHSDKTKDMPADAVMAFCSFYDEAELARLERSAKDPYDYVHRKQSGLMRLHFRLKGGVEAQALAEGAQLVPEFSVTLYPNSVFFIPLSTNRLYTHELRASMLNVEQAATRMGYVVRCSDCEAVFVDGQTHIREGDELAALAPMDVEGVRALRGNYLQENSTAADVRYGRVPFSMNAGDYLEPRE